MEIVQEYDNWRRVRDSEGAEGWINQSLLSGRRTALVAPWQRGESAQIPLRARPDAEAALVAQLEPGVMGTVRSCDGQWCRLEFDGPSGYLEQALVWGVYPGEKLED
jgi:SH3-like domain-containing protein